MTRTNNDNTIKKNQCLFALFLSKYVNLFEKVSIRIDIGPAVINSTQFHDLAPLICDSTGVVYVLPVESRVRSTQ